MSKTPPVPFRPTVFLFRMLAGIFLVEALLLSYSFVKCSNSSNAQPTALLAERCPRLGQRAENIFEIAIATTLSLLAGSTAINTSASNTSQVREELTKLKSIDDVENKDVRTE